MRSVARPRRIDARGMMCSALALTVVVAHPSACESPDLKHFLAFVVAESIFNSSALTDPNRWKRFMQLLIVASSSSVYSSSWLWIMVTRSKMLAASMAGLLSKRFRMVLKYLTGSGLGRGVERVQALART